MTSEPMEHEAPAVQLASGTEPEPAPPGLRDFCTVAEWLAYWVPRIPVTEAQHDRAIAAFGLKTIGRR